MTRLHAVGAAIFGGAIAGIAACVPHPAVAPEPTADAPFVVTHGSAEAAARTPTATAADSARCTLAFHFDGNARTTPRELEVVLAHGWVAMTRNNDKRWDDLHLRIQARGVGAERAVVLTPTVDSAGPQLTTWQADDTTRVLLPLAAGEQPGRLFFFVSYHTVGYAGKFAGCDAVAGSGPLDFQPMGTARR